MRSSQVPFVLLALGLVWLCSLPHTQHTPLPPPVAMRGPGRRVAAAVTGLLALMAHTVMCHPTRPGCTGPLPGHGLPSPGDGGYTLTVRCMCGRLCEDASSLMRFACPANNCPMHTALQSARRRHHSDSGRYHPVQRLPHQGGWRGHRPWLRGHCPGCVWRCRPQQPGRQNVCCRHPAARQQRAAQRPGVRASKRPLLV